MTKYITIIDNNEKPKKSEEKKGIINEIKDRTDIVKENIDNVKNSKNILDGAANVAKVGVSIARVGTGLIKAPLAFTIKAVSLAMPVTWEVLVQPIHIPCAFFSKTINPDNPYNGQKINEFGDFLGTTMKDALNEASNVVMKVL